MEPVNEHEEIKESENACVYEREMDILDCTFPSKI